MGVATAVTVVVIVLVLAGVDNNGTDGGFSFVDFGSCC